MKITMQRHTVDGPFGQEVIRPNTKWAQQARERKLYPGMPVWAPRRYCIAFTGAGKPVYQDRVVYAILEKACLGGPFVWVRYTQPDARTRPIRQVCYHHEVIPAKRPEPLDTSAYEEESCPTTRSSGRTTN